MYADEVVIYADLLFLINFSMDYLCLFITSRLLNRGGRIGRLVTASVIGALYSFVPYCISLNTVFFLILSLAAALFICLVAFGRHEGKDFIQTTVTFIVSSALMGGLITAIYNLFGKYHQGAYREISATSFALICLISAGVALSYGLICKRRIHTSSAELRLIIKNEIIRVRLLADSGNLVTEPFSALPVIIISSSAIPNPYNNPESEAFPLSLRAIPFSTAAGKGCFFGFRPDKIEILSLGKKPRTVAAYIAVDTTKNNYSGYDGIVPASLL